MEKSKYSWVIHAVKPEPDLYFPGMLDAHTHGLNEFGSLELQLSLHLKENLIGYLLNTVGEMIANGKKFKDGDLIEDVLTDGAKILVYQTRDCMGDPILRLILPDEKFRYPEDSDEVPYMWQYDGPYLPAKSLN